MFTAAPPILVAGIPHQEATVVDRTRGQRACRTTGALVARHQVGTVGVAVAGGATTNAAGTTTTDS